MAKSKVEASSFKDVYERMYLQDIPITEIHRTSIQLGDDFSVMALYRYFKSFKKESLSENKPKLITEDDRIVLFIELFDNLLNKREIIDFLKWFKEQIKKGKSFTEEKPYYTKSILYSQLKQMIEAYNPNYLNEFEDIWKKIWSLPYRQHGREDNFSFNQYYGYEEVIK